VTISYHTAPVAEISTIYCMFLILKFLFCNSLSTNSGNIGLAYQSLGEPHETLEIFEEIGAVEKAENMKQKITRLEALFNELVHKIY